MLFYEERELPGQFTGVMAARNAMEVLKSYHPETHDHSHRVMKISVDLGIENEIRGRDLGVLALAALFHDIGKLNVPVEILDKSGKLNESEWAAMEQHPLDGMLILNGLVDRSHIFSADYIEAGAVIERTHSWSRARSYPAHKASKETEMAESFSQIISASDKFDSLYQDRPYRNGLTLAEIQRELTSDFTGNPFFVQQVLRRHPQSGNIQNGGLDVLAAQTQH